MIYSYANQSLRIFSEGLHCFSFCFLALAAEKTSSENQSCCSPKKGSKASHSQTITTAGEEIKNGAEKLIFRSVSVSVFNYL